MFFKSVADGHFVNRISRFQEMPKFSSNGVNLNITSINRNSSTLLYRHGVSEHGLKYQNMF